MYETLIKQILTNPWVGLLGYVLAIVSFLLTIIFYYKSKKTKSITYLVRTQNLIDDTLKNNQNIKVSYKGARINDLFSSKVVIWNNGDYPILRADIPNKDKLKLTSSDSTDILDFEILSDNNPSNAFSFTLDSSYKFIDIDFDYLNQGQAIYLQVFHKGTPDTEIYLNGSIIGKKDIIQHFEYREPLITESSGYGYGNVLITPTFRGIGYFLLASNAAISITIMIGIFIFDFNMSWRGFSPISQIFIFLWIFSFFGSLLIAVRSTRRVPKGFKKFFD